MRVYGSKVSYFTGKLEAYLRYKGITYERRPLIRYQKQIRAHLGTTQMPAVELDDGLKNTIGWYQANEYLPIDGAAISMGTVGNVRSETQGPSG